MPDTIRINEALSEMSRLTKAKTPFQFSYITCDLQRNKGGDEKTVEKAYIRSSPINDHILSETMFLYKDDQGKKRRCHKAALVSFNDKIITFR